MQTNGASGTPPPTAGFGPSFSAPEEHTVYGKHGLRGFSPRGMSLRTKIPENGSGKNKPPFTAKGRRRMLILETASMQDIQQPSRSMQAEIKTKISRHPAEEKERLQKTDNWPKKKLSLSNEFRQNTQWMQ